MDNPWPPDVPWSLWKYQGINATDIPQVPMMGVVFAKGFLYAFAFGCIFVAFFSYSRFRSRNRNPVGASSQVLRDLQIIDLGGQNSLTRAYFIYAGAMLILYVSLTFFGRLIFQATQMVPIAGIAVDVSELKFDSPQWPLTLAFAFAGLADLLPPVRIAEEFLRNRAFRAAGIPVRVEQTTRSIIASFESRSSQNGDDGEAVAKSTNPLAKLLKHSRRNWEQHFLANERTKHSLETRPARYDELLSLLSEIELLLVWAKTERGGWPGFEVSSRVRDAEAKYVAEGDKLLNELHRRLQETVDRSKSQHSSARFDEYLSSATEKAVIIRFELVTLLAIFLERDPDSPSGARTADPEHPKPIDALAYLLKTADRPDSVGSGPETGLLVLFIPTFILFAASSWQGFLEMVGQYVETSNVAGVVLTSLIETLRIASLTFLPLLAAFSLRQYLWDTKDWAGVAPRKKTRRAARLNQIMTCLGLGLGASVIGLAGVALLRAFAIARNGDYLNALLFTGPNPFMLYYPTLAVTVIPLVPLCLMAADARASGRSGYVHASLAACAVLFLLIAHGTFWDPSWLEACLTTSEVVTAPCSRRLDTLSRLVLIALVFVSISVLGAPGRTRPRARADSAKALFALVLATAAAISLVSPVVAQDTHSSPAPSIGKNGQLPTPETIRVGFREDVEPFSYLITDEAHQSRYIGYLADLCHEIFDVPEYVIEEVSVTAANRFKLVNGKPVGDKQPIQVLCDAVTMRFSMPWTSANDDDKDERNAESIYSPIVFASGVSYLMRSSREPNIFTGDVVIGYVSGTTAADVALKSCSVDLLRVIAPTERERLYERCHFLDSAAALEQKIRRYKASRDSDPNDASKSLANAIGKARSSASVLSATVFKPEQKGDPPPSPPSQQFAKAFEEAIAKICPDPKAPCVQPDQTPPDQDTPLDRLAAASMDPVCTSPFKPASAMNASSWREYHFCPQESHNDLIKWFCQNYTDIRPVYMGDRELILGKLESWKSKNAPCVVEEPTGIDYLTYEPYALLISSDRPELVRFVQKRVYQIFSHRKTATALFSSYFPDRKMSPALAYLFLLNGVDLEDGYLMPGDLEPTASDRSTIEMHQ
ncbi:type 2 periplasmic-binding domain-containing protein [Rhizobium ruizarguesonis]|uniref:hypothetical protein n=1 Tax=Rhizobium ruizarguesonis TaxID=2081791 RepID=UPI001031C728|nr:hypothetical protein [Rhizobium ruizarguesonis]NEH32599.1 hypothetical protein [Rhizobium ruizarguesonis]NEK12982.1 hypothetical protein [Rhizobium ruizarguesonis]TBD24987.1 hypothetical protein ELH18_35655 [Rhizobium ruizarguesonis]TBD26051.1 hypothetical protein ELH19_34260 [Rhizobium ruizarguesonis]TBD51267.1 hypothetical protein ELH15_33785 [Rhizobium ruizarguesonis]